MQKIDQWWAAAAGAILIVAVVGVGAVMAQETPEASPTGTAQQTPEASPTGTAQQTPEASPTGTARQTPTAEATSPAEETPGAGDDDEDTQPKPRSGGCGTVVDAEALAGFLGITEAQLRTELQADGATLASVAQAHGQSRDSLKTFLTEQAQTRLAAKVAEGDLTQEEADARLAEYTANLDAVIDRSPPTGRGFKRDFESEPEESTPSSGSSLSGTGVS